MKELNNFREFLYESQFKVGDKVTMTSGGEDMEIIKTRRMFGSNVNAYTVKNVGGDEYEYDESQLKLAEGKLDDQLDILFRLSIGAHVSHGEDRLYKLTQAWERWNVENDDKYDELVDPLYAAVELVQDAGVPGVNDVEDDKEYRMYIKSADKHLKQFNKDVAAVAKGLNENKTQLNESAPGYDTRKFGGALPTLESVKAAYEAKEKDLEDDSYEVDGTSVGDGKYEDEESEKQKVKEGIWKIGNADDISKFIDTLEVIKDDYYAVVGSDTVMDGLDMAIKGAKELLDPGGDDSYNSRD